MRIASLHVKLKRCTLARRSNRARSKSRFSAYAKTQIRHQPKCGNMILTYAGAAIFHATKKISPSWSVTRSAGERQYMPTFSEWTLCVTDTTQDHGSGT